MRNKYPKFTFKKIHPDTVVTQLEFLKSDKRAKSYKELKNGKIGIIRNFALCLPSGIPVGNRNSGCSQTGIPVPHPDFRFAADSFEN